VEVPEAIAIRYLGEEGGRAFVRSLDDHDSVLFTIRPDRWLTADFSGDLEPPKARADHSVARLCPHDGDAECYFGA
jgi:hypothetical protein